MAQFQSSKYKRFVYEGIDLKGYVYLRDSSNNIFEIPFTIPESIDANLQIIDPEQYDKEQGLYTFWNGETDTTSSLITLYRPFLGSNRFVRFGMFEACFLYFHTGESNIINYHIYDAWLKFCEDPSIGNPITISEMKHKSDIVK